MGFTGRAERGAAGRRGEEEVERRGEVRSGGEQLAGVGSSWKVLRGERLSVYCSSNIKFNVV